jgi:hypothetical protein
MKSYANPRSSGLIRALLADTFGIIFENAE